MANVFIKLKVMPASAEVDKDELKATCSEIIEKHGGKIHKAEEEPIAFGLVALNFIFMRDESKGDAEDIEKKLSKLDTVMSAETTDVRRAFG